MSADESVERAILADPGCRGVGHLYLAHQLAPASRSLLEGSSVAIATGFFLPQANAPETDGPPGALALGIGLSRLNKRVQYVTGRQCAEVLSLAGLAPMRHYEKSQPIDSDVTHLIAVECPGRAADGCYYSMSAIDLSPCDDAVDQCFLDAKKSGIATIGIGDGGNEIGMGKVADKTRCHIPHGGSIACTVETDWLIVAGTSNWGAWGLLTSLSIQSRQWLLPSVDEATEHVRQCVAAGAVDGRNLRRECTVDGLDMAAYTSVLVELESILEAEGVRR